MKTVLRIMLSLVLCITTMFINPLSINKYTYAARGLEFEVCPDMVTDSTITVTAHPDNDEACNVTISWESDWLTITPSQITLAPGGKKDVKATINSRGLTPGRYTDKIMLESNCKPNYTEIPVFLRVLNPVIHIDNPYQEWELPPVGSVDKQFTILNRLCDTTVSFHTDESSTGTVELSVPEQTTIKQGERLRIPVRVETDGFLKPETRRIIIRAFDSEVGTVSISLVPITDPPIVRVDDLIGDSARTWEGREIELSSHLIPSSPPVITDELPVCDDPDTPYRAVLRVEDPGGHLRAEDHGSVIFGTFRGVYREGSLRLTKPIERHFTPLLQYPQTHSAFSDWGKFPLESNHFFLYLQADSNFPPSIHECITAEALKTISHIPFNRKHSGLFLPFKKPTVQTDDLFSGECRKKYSISAIEEAFTSFDEPMRRVLRTGETPTLWIHLSGLWHTRNGQKCLLINGKSLSLESIKKQLMKLSILGPVVILLDCNEVEDLQSELCDIGNCRTVDVSCGDENRVCYPTSLSSTFYNDLVDQLTPKECEIDWDEFLRSMQDHCPFMKGYEYSETLECNEVSREKSINRKDIDIVRYRIKLIQKLTQRNNNDIEKKTEDITVFFTDFPIPRIEPSPPCPPVPLPIDFSDCPSGDSEESEPIELEGIVRELDPDKGKFGVDSFFDVFMEIEIPERDMPVEVGDRVRVTGTLQGETTVIPETIEVIEKECAIGVNEIEPKIYCPTCFTWDYEEQAYAEYEDLEYVLSNSGDIGASIGVSSKVDQIEGSLPITFKVTWSPTSFALPAKSSYNLKGELEIHNVPELVPEIQIFLITTTFSISPEPCPKTITKTFRVTLCPTERTINGRVSFKNVQGNQCGIANATVRLYLRYEPECGHDRSFTVEMGALEGVHHSAKQDLPDYSLYLETKTDSQGYYRFHFIDKDCKHEYRVLVLFKNEYMNLTYQDCSNTFFVFSDIDGVQEPCRETTTERNLYIGQSTNLVFPADFTHDARSMAQIYCHMMESFGIFASLKCGDDPMLKDSMMPLKVCGYSGTAGTYYHPEVSASQVPLRERVERHINIHRNDSSIYSGNRPINREWHEFGHFLQDSLMNLPKRDRGDRNHAGFSNSNSKDSLAEGIAEFTSMLIHRMIKNKDSCCDKYSLKNGSYQWRNGVADIENDNWCTAPNAIYGYYSGGNLIRVNREDLHIDRNGNLTDNAGHVITMEWSTEEYAAAALLLDLVDNAGWYDETTSNSVIHGEDDDGFSMPSWQDIYCLLQEYKPQTMKDLYDSLQEKYRGNRNALQKINNIFVKQGFFEDHNLNGQRDAGENIGSTHRPGVRYCFRNSNGDLVYRDIQDIPSRPDVPVVPGSCLKVHFLDEQGKPVPNELVNITVISLDSPVYFTYQQRVEDDSLLYVYLTPNSNAMVRISLANETGKVVVLSSETLWNSIGQNKPFVAEVTFDAQVKPAHSVWHVKLQPEETVNVIQNTITKGHFVYWNESSAIEECKVQVDKPWVHIPNPELNKTSGIIDFTIDSKNLPLGKNKVIVTHRQNGNIIDYLLCVNVLPAEKVITLTIGKQEATVNETSIQLDAPPFIQPPGRTMVPLRFISEAFGASIDYFPKTGNVTDVVLLFRCIDVHLHIGKTEAEIMNETTTLDAPPIIKQGRTYVPLRFISESFGAEIGWDGKTQKITITLKEVLSN